MGGKLYDMNSALWLNCAAYVVAAGCSGQCVVPGGGHSHSTFTHLRHQCEATVGWGHTLLPSTIGPQAASHFSSGQPTEAGRPHVYELSRVRPLVAAHTAGGQQSDTCTLKRR